jgi:hypothetical protein
MKIYVILICLLNFNFVLGQNLVPNPSFENHNYCTISDYFITSIQDWKSPNSGTPDYFRICANLVPTNHSGFQSPNSGDSYCGILIRSSGVKYPFYQPHL